MRREFASARADTRYARDQVVDITHIALAIELDIPGRAIHGVCSLTMVPIAATIRHVELDAAELDIHRVTVAGEEIPFRHDGDRLRIGLERARPVMHDADVDEPVVVDIEYSGHPRRGLYFIAPDAGYPDKPRQVWSHGQESDARFWFPCFDAPHQKASSEMIVTLPSRFFALSNGVLVDDQISGDVRRLHWQLAMPHSCYLITLVVGELVAIEDRWRDVPVLYYASPGREHDVVRTLRRTPEMLEFFSRAFDTPYPYPSYAQVFVSDFHFDGMENASATTLSDEFLLTERAALDGDHEALVAHELAHQWFGNLVTCRDWGESWLQEGFATYAEYLWREHRDGRDAAALELDDWASEYFTEDREGYRRRVRTKVYDHTFAMFDHHAYNKGGRVIHMLHRILGDDGFRRSIAAFLARHGAGRRNGSRGAGVVETHDLIRAVESATGRALDWFFDQWIVQGTGYPELTIRHEWDADQGQACLWIEQVQQVTSDTPLFRLPARVRYRVGQRDEDRAIEITRQRERLIVALEEEPSQVIFDPGKHLLAQVEFDKPVLMLAAELSGASEAIDRIDAARALAARGGHQAVRALIQALRDDRFWAVRAAAATALGEIGGGVAREALIAALARPAMSAGDHRTRRRVVEALGMMTGDERAGETLAALVERGDASGVVEAEACLALGKSRHPRAGAMLRQVVQRPSVDDGVRSLAYAGLAAARDRRAVPLLRAATVHGQPPQGRYAALSALARLAAGLDEREAREVRELAESLLDDRDKRMQDAAVEALRTIAHRDSIAALQRLVDRELHGPLQQQAQAVIRALEHGRAVQESLDAMRDELARMKQEMSGLVERIDHLEARHLEAGGDDH